MRRIRFVFIALLLLLSASAFAQITAVPNLMNFQGRLARPDGTPVADGDYSIRFSLWDALAGGAEKWSQTVDPVAVKNGTFAVLLSGFPAGTFNGNLWLEIKIGADAALIPRQQVVSVAYSFKADSVKDGAITSASILNGTITAADFAPNLFNTLAWLLGGNSGTNPATQFLGTTDNVALSLRTNNRRAMRYQYGEILLPLGAEYRSINTLGGADINSIGAGVVGATIAGGGQDYFTAVDLPNMVTAHFGTIGGGVGNTVSGVRATIGGGNFNTAGGQDATVGGGISNNASGPNSAIAGGFFNTAGGAIFGSAFVGGGSGNTAGADYATVGGGRSNTASAIRTTVGGGFSNDASDDYATIGGGENNTASNDYATVAGGSDGIASGQYATVAGGNDNIASGFGAAVGGGDSNTASGGDSFIGSGSGNTASGSHAVVAGGQGNTASGSHAAVPGGIENTALGLTSFAAGRQAKANHNGAFVWADNQAADFVSTDTNQFLIRASGGVGIGTNNPTSATLRVVETVSALWALEVEGGDNNGASAPVKIASGAQTLLLDGNEIDSNVGLYLNNNSAQDVLLAMGGGNVGIGDSTPTYRLELPNIANSSGQARANAWQTYSSGRWKHNIVPIENALDKALRLNGVMFDWNPEHGGTHDIGFVAEDVGKVVPELVGWEADGKFATGLKYDRITALLVEAMKTQNKQIETLKADKARLETHLKALTEAVRELQSRTK